MSRLKRSKITILCFVFTSAALLAMAQEDSTHVIANDPILAYFWQRADATMTSGNPNDRGISYSYIATTYYKQIGKLGAVDWTDSLSTAYYFSFGKLDSSKARRTPTRGEIPTIRFDAPNIFANDYYLNDFPNDTGGASLSIGFDSDSTLPNMPTGIAIIDRSSYFPRWLYLHYPHEEGYRRFTRSFRFTVRDGFIFPDSIWEVATKYGLFFPTSYRLETRIDSLTIYR